VNVPVSFWGLLVALVIESWALWQWRALLTSRGVSLRVIATLALTLLGGAAPLAVAFAVLPLNLERAQSWVWGYVCWVTATIGFIAAVRKRTMPGLMDLLLGAVLACEGAALTLLATHQNADFAGATTRMMLVAPAAVILFLYFGASLGHLLLGGGRLDTSLGYEGQVGRRFLLAKGSPVISTVTTISVVGVALGVWLVIIALGILSGFEDDLQDKIIGANAHISLQHKRGIPFATDRADLERLATLDDVVAFAPSLEGEVALASQNNYTGGMLFGIDPEHSPEVLNVLKQLTQGSLDPLIDEMRPAPAAPDDGGEFRAPAPVPSLVIGREMANTMNVKVGDRVRVISPLLEVLTPIGPAPRSLDFRVAAVFSSKMYEFDARYAFASLTTTRRFFELEAPQVTSLQIAVRDPERSDAVGMRAQQLLDADGNRGLESLDWKRRNQTLFSALKLERVVAFIVLAFIILVASFSIVNTLTMSVIEKRKEIAILKTMGAQDVGVMKLFLVQGMLVGTFGTIIGVVAALITAALLKMFGFGIPGEVYYIDSLPVHVSGADVLLVVLAALVIVWDFAVFPALVGSRLRPVEGLRDG